MVQAVTFDGNNSYVQQASAENEGDQTLPLLAKGGACKTTLVCTVTHILDHGGSRKTSEFPIHSNGHNHMLTEMIRVLSSVSAVCVFNQTDSTHDEIACRPTSSMAAAMGAIAWQKKIVRALWSVCATAHVLQNTWQGRGF